MKKISPTAARLMICVAAITALFWVVGLVVILFFHRFAPPLSYTAGLAVGGAVSAWKVYMMQRSFESLAGKPGEKANNIGTLFFLVRYLLTAAFLVVAFLLPGWLNPVGAVGGIVSLQFASYATAAWERKLDKGKPKNYRPYEEVVAEEEREKQEREPEKEEREPEKEEQGTDTQDEVR